MSIALCAGVAVLGYGVGWILRDKKLKTPRGYKEGGFYPPVNDGFGRWNENSNPADVKELRVGQRCWINDNPNTASSEIEEVEIVGLDENELVAYRLLDGRGIVEKWVSVNTVFLTKGGCD